MGKVLTFKNTDTDYLDFYEVTDDQGIAVWGGGQAREAVAFFRQSIGNRLYVSKWVEDGLEARMIGEAVDITDLITETIKNTLERAV